MMNGKSQLKAGVDSADAGCPVLVSPFLRDRAGILTSFQPCGRAALQAAQVSPNIVIPSEEDDSLCESSSESTESAVQSTSTNGKGTAEVPRMPAFSVLGWRASALPGTTHNDDYERMKRAPCTSYEWKSQLKLRRSGRRADSGCPVLVSPSLRDRAGILIFRAQPRTGRAWL